jgi:NAD(P)-dependent dehydrogenase (short-subunit alcohol dehydrogenase family)
MAEKIVLVTGGSRGIGAATCRLAARRGYDVAVNYVQDEAAARSVAADVEACGSRAVAVQGDVAEEADIERIFAEIDRRLGRLTHLVNNAGITGRSGRVDEADPAMMRRVIELNVVGTILCSRAATRRMSTRHGGGGGAIVNLSSAAATLGMANEYAWYAAAKGAVDSFTVGLARELAREGVRVNAVAPGLIETEIHAASGDAGRIARLAPNIPAGRPGSADEVAETILFLLSDAASYVTGSVLRVSGGR